MAYLLKKELCKHIPNELGEKLLLAMRKIGCDSPKILREFQQWLLVDPKHGVIKYAKNKKVVQNVAGIFAEGFEKNKLTTFEKATIYANIVGTACKSALVNGADGETQAYTTTAMAFTSEIDLTPCRASRNFFMGQMSNIDVNDVAEYAVLAQIAKYSNAVGSDDANRSIAASCRVRDVTKATRVRQAEKLIELIEER